MEGNKNALISGAYTVYHIKTLLSSSFCGILENIVKKPLFYNVTQDNPFSHSSSF
jgi:hypothetical protein